MPKSALIHLPRLQTQALGSAILKSLAEMVRLADLQVGDQLPPEVQIAEQLGVSRSTVREALNRWEGIGLIRRRRGVGTFIAAPIPQPDAGVDANTQLDGDAILRLLEARLGLETKMVRLAAERATALQRTRIEELCDELMAVVASGESYIEADVAFHRAVAEASANPIFDELLSMLNLTIQKSRGSPFDLPAFGRLSFPFHCDLKDAIVVGDPDAAEAAQVKIIDSVADEVRRMISRAPGAS